MAIFAKRTQPAADRIAAIALLRALLSQATALPSLSAQHRTELHHLIRNRFRRARGITNPAKLRLYFTAGYEALDHLDAAAAGDEARRATVLALLARAPANARAPRPSPARKVASAPSSTASVAAAAPDNDVDAVAAGGSESSNLSSTPSPGRPPRISLFDRPLPLSALSGPRHVPVIFNAAQIPVLRLKKPQPAVLSAFISSRLLQRQRRLDRRQALIDAMQVAEREDAWDAIVREEMAREPGGRTTIPGQKLSLRGREGEGEERGQGESQGQQQQQQQQQQEEEEEEEEEEGKEKSIKQEQDLQGTGREPRWTDLIEVAMQEVVTALALEKHKNGRMAARMQAIVDAERELWEKEQGEAMSRDEGSEGRIQQRDDRSVDVT